MTFAVILIALLVERFFDFSHLRRWNWYLSYQQKVIHLLKAPTYLNLIGGLFPLLIIVSILEWVLNGRFFGLIEWLFQLGAFLYCLGPQNLWADTFACMNALSQGDQQTAGDKLKSVFPYSQEVQAMDLSSSPSETSTLFNQLLGQVFIAANQRIFAVVFWFLVLGPIGAVFYRALALVAAKSVKNDTDLGWASKATKMVFLLDWVPVRVFVIVFALSGHFVKVFSCWRKKDIFGSTANDQLITECGVAALSQEELGTQTEGTAIKNAIGLVDRSLVIMLVLAALIVLLG